MYLGGGNGRNRPAEPPALLAIDADLIAALESLRSNGEDARGGRHLVRGLLAFAGVFGHGRGTARLRRAILRKLRQINWRRGR